VRPAGNILAVIRNARLNEVDKFNCYKSLFLNLGVYNIERVGLTA